MAANPIYIDSEEEILEVVERLRQASFDQLTLIVPSRSRLGQSRFNFKLLHSFARQLGKRVAVVSADPAVQQMAAEAGLDIEGPVAGEPAREESSRPAAADQLGAWAPDGDTGRGLWSSGRSSGAAPAASAVVAPIPARTEQAPVGAPIPRSGAGGPAAPGRILLYIGAGAVMLSGILLLVVFIPSASVSLTTEAAPITLEHDVRAQPGQRGPVRVRVATLSKQASGNFKATGVRTTPAASATGSVTYTNRCPFGLQIYNGQGLHAGPVGFVQQGDVLIAHAKTATAPVAAQTPGAAGNVGGGLINSIDGNIYDCITVANTSPTTGGVDEKKDAQVSQADWDAARGKLEQDLRRQLGDDLGRQAASGEKLADPVFAAPEFATDHKVGDVVTDFSGSMTIKAEGTLYQVDDVKRAVLDDFKKQVAAQHPDQMLVDGSMQADYQVVSAAGGGQITFHGKATGYLAPKLDIEQIRSHTAGKPVDQAQIYLKQLPVHSAGIAQRPLKLPWMPLLGSRIEVHDVVERGPGPKKG